MINNVADDDSSLEDEDVRSNRHAIRLFGIGENSVLSLYFLNDNDVQDEDDDETLQQHRVSTREPKWIHLRLCWESHVAVLVHENLFGRTYRMSVDAFRNLRDLLGESIYLQAHRTPVPEPIYPELVMAVGIRYLSGGKCLDLKNAYGLSLPSVYRTRDIFIDAVNSCPDLIDRIKLPQTLEEMAAVARGFEEHSTSQLIRGCIGCIDGFLAVTRRPTMKDSNNNPGAFFSGHYGMYGLNVQAVCDRQSRFLFFGVVAPGKCGDQVAFERTPLYDYVQNVPPGYYLIGDAAYTVGESLLTPFTGGHRNDPIKDAYNFFLSQLRIRIEMAFGLLTNKWRVLNAPLQTSLARSSDILMACARLHNYCIDMNDQHSGEPYYDNSAVISRLQRMPPQRHAPLGWPFLPTVETYCPPIRGTSMTRDMILRRVEQRGMRRPNANLERRRYELHEIGLM